MLENLNVIEIGEVGFIINPLVRHNVYKTPRLLNEWSGNEFEGILKSIKSHLGGMWSVSDKKQLFEMF